MNPIDDQRAAAVDRATVFARTIASADRPLIAASPAVGEPVAAMFDRTAPKCPHLSVVPLQPSIMLGLRGLARCGGCFQRRLVQHLGTCRRCDQCGGPFGPKRYPAVLQAAHWVIFLLLCANCTPPKDLLPPQVSRPCC